LRVASDLPAVRRIVISRLGDWMSGEGIRSGNAGLSVLLGAE